MNTAMEIQQRGIPLDDAPSHYGPSFYERLAKEFMLAGRPVPRSPDDLPQMISLDLRQLKCVRTGSVICGAAGLAFDEVKVLHFSEATPIGYAEALAEARITEIPGVYYAPSRVPVHILPRNTGDLTETQIQESQETRPAQEPVETGLSQTQTQVPVDTAEPTPSRPRKHGSAPYIREAIQALLAEGNSLQDAKIDENRYPIIRKRVLELHRGAKFLSNSNIYTQLRDFEF